MPTYDYRCRKCEHQFEVFHGIHDRSIQKCPRCGGRARKVPAGGAGLLFRGSGFYITDHRSKDYKEKAKQEKKEKAKQQKSGDAKPSSGDSGAKGGPKKGPEKS